MRIIRYGEAGNERPGVIDDAGYIRDLSRIVPDITGAVLHPESLRKLASLIHSHLPIVQEEVRIGACVGMPSKFICVGLNYHEHINEVGQPTPTEPIIFMKAPSAVCGAFDDVIIPAGAAAVDWEVELGLVIGSRACGVPLGEGLSHVAGFCIVNDISERNWQLHGSGQWVKGKSADTFAPVGPWLVTLDEVRDPQNLSLQLSVNGKLQQKGTTSDMVFSVDFLVSYISRFMTLLPGDIISTGTPPGVGMGQKPPRYLRTGDVMELTVSGLGSQKQQVVDKVR